MGHRPMYCSNDDNDDCILFDDRVKKIILYKFYVLEIIDNIYIK